MFVFLSGCETINQASQCDPEKNYIISNPQAMEEYKSLRKNGEVESYYIMNLPSDYCNSNKCVTYDNEKFSYFEQYFNDKERVGVYTIKAYANSENRKCMPEAISTKNRSIKYCYEAVKNKNDEVKSRYKYVYDKTNENQIIISVYDIKKNIQLYEYSYQIYSNRAIGGSGFGTCPKSQNNNPNYKFNAVSFLMDN